VTWPAPVLKRPCEPVEQFDEELTTLLDDMRQTMADADGLGLAANQVGVSTRLFIMGIPQEEEGEIELIEVINPVIEARRGEIKYEEGCLSFPEVYQQVLRAAEIDVTYADREGQTQARTFNGLASVCFQHELDHLDGVVFLDRLSPLKRRLALRAYTRSQRNKAEEEREAHISGMRGPR